MKPVTHILRSNPKNPAKFCTKFYRGITGASILVVASTLVALQPDQAMARDQIQVVGSSTVFPFSTTVAETFAKTTDFKAPVVESTGSGGGFKLFCQGVGEGTPDITNASRAIKQSEIDTCAGNGVTDIIEIKIGYDGIVIANAKSAPTVELTKQQLFQALAKTVEGKDGKLIDNPYQNWSDIDGSLPAVRIEVLGPPPTSGTRDAFLELVMEEGAEGFSTIKALGKNEFKAVSHGLREDGGYIEAGENDNLIIQKLEANPDAFGIFGYSFLEENIDKVKGAPVAGVEPTFESISAGDYGVSRPLFFYVKKAHIGVIPGLEEFLAEFTSEKAWGEEGYLTDKALIPMADEERAMFARRASNQEVLQ